MMQQEKLFSQAGTDWEHLLYKNKMHFSGCTGVHHLSNISDLLSQITSYFTQQSLKKLYFKLGHMEKCTSVTSEGFAFSCNGL